MTRKKHKKDEDLFHKWGMDEEVEREKRRQKLRRKKSKDGLKRKREW